MIASRFGGSHCWSGGRVILPYPYLVIGPIEGPSVFAPVDVDDFVCQLATQIAISRCCPLIAVGFHTGTCVQPCVLLSESAIVSATGVISTTPWVKGK